MKFSLKAVGAALALMALLLIPSAVRAQVRSATLSGTVQDPAGRVVSGANVTATEAATHQTSTGKTNDTGNFTIPYLPAGSYSVKVETTGFQTTSQAGIAVGNGEDIHLSIALKIGTQNEIVQVNTEASGIQVDSPVVQSVVGEQVIASIPNIAHNPLAYVGLEAGINTRGAQASQTNSNSFGIGIYGRRQISDFAINGGQAFENDVQLDGLSTQSPGFNEVTIVINQDAIQEVRALVNNYSAQYGRAHGIIAETSKGGTDQLHGLAFMRNRSSALNANSYFNNNQGIAKPPSEIWTYGGTVGGPIRKSKAFFFASFEGLYYDNPRTFLRTIPTAAERIGDFSQSFANVNGVATPLNLYDPFNVTQTGPNVYQRAQIANANTSNSLRGTNQFALNVLKNYPCAAPVTGLAPCTNRKPDDAFNTNNYQSTGVQQFRKANFNGRVDYHLSTKNFLYVSGGYTRSNITNPLIWDGKTLWNPFVSLGDERFASDRNPYVTIGDTQILSPTLVVDFHYGVSRVDTTDNSDLVPSGFDYSSLGVSAIDQANSSINVIPSFSVTGGNWTAPNNNQYVNKHERQLHHVVSGSMTKTAGRWTFKGGGEFRAYLANYIDAQTSFLYTLSNSFTLPTVNSSGGQVGSITANNGGNPWASFLLGAGSVGVPAGNAVHPAFLHQYAAVYTQNDWRPTDKLTINLGLRWDWQPGVEDRYNRISAVDLNATNPFGGKGGIYFPGANGNSHRLWDTDWTNFQPRVGFAYRPTPNTVVRGGAGVTFLPSNTGFFDGPSNFGTSPFASYTNSQPYGFGVQNGIPVGTFDSAAVNQFVVAPGSNLNAPANYGAGSGPRFLVHDYKNSYVYQGNLHVQQALTQRWTLDLGYNVEVGKRLPTGSGYQPNNDQLLPDSTLQNFRASYIARNGTGSIGSDQVANPFQPDPNHLIPFAGNIGKATLPYDQTLWAYPLLGSFAALYNHGFSTYHALQASLHRDFSQGLLVGTNFTWSRSLGVDGGLAQNNFAGEGSYNSFPDLRTVRANKRLSPNDTPIRFASYAVYELPFGKGKAFAPANGFVRGLVSGYRLGGTYIWQSGVPQQVSFSGSLNGLPDRNPGVPFLLPNSYQHFYDGKTSIVLPYSGRTITPCAKCFLKFNPDAFRGRTVQVANGTTQSDTYYFGNSSTNYGDLRTDPVDNVTMSLSRNFRFRERYAVEVQANVTNVLNHTQFAPGGFNGSLGSVQVPGAVPTAQSALQTGYGNGTTYGTHNNTALDPRLVELQARISF